MYKYNDVKLFFFKKIKNKQLRLSELSVIRTFWVPSCSDNRGWTVVVTRRVTFQAALDIAHHVRAHFVEYDVHVLSVLTGREYIENVHSIAEI